MEITPDIEDHGKTTVEKDMEEPKIKEEMAFDSLLKALSDLEKREKEILDAIRMKNLEQNTHQEFVVGETLGASQQFDHLSPTA